MFNLFARRPKPDAAALADLKSMVTELLSLDDADHIAVAELACDEPGCPDLETVVTVTRAHGETVVLRFPGAVADVTSAEVQNAGRRQDTR